MRVLAASCEADVVMLREKQVKEGGVAHCLVRKRVEEDDFLETR